MELAVRALQLFLTAVQGKNQSLWGRAFFTECLLFFKHKHME